MLKNYLIVAFRSILKQRLFSLINIIGLAIGISASVLIFMHVEDEFSYDKFIPEAENTYKVFLERLYPDHTTKYAIIPFSYGPVVQSDIPGVKNYARLFGNLNNSATVRYVDSEGQEQVFEENKVMFADSTFFDVVQIELLNGDPLNPFGVGNRIILTEETALRYFGSSDAIGKTLTVNNIEYVVSGVAMNIPENSHLDFDFVANISSIFGPETPDNFVNFSVYTYLKLEEGADPKAIESQFNSLVEKYAAPQIERGLQMNYQDYINAGNGYKYSLVNIQDIHLLGIPYQMELKSGGSRVDTYIFISIAVLIMLIACINFMNLSIARSTERSKEVGIRKSLGSQKSQLIRQFLTESILISLFSLIIGLCIVFFTLPYFNQLIEKELLFPIDSFIIPALIILAIIIGILSGAYPAFFISSLNTIYVLKGNVKKGKTSNWLRNSLVVFQFAISIILIVGTLTMNEQMNFINNKDLGFDRENVLIIERAQVLQNQQSSYISEIEKLSSVNSVGRSFNIPAAQYFGISFTPQGANEAVVFNGDMVDDHYIETLGHRIIKGEGFSENRNDSLSIIVNEKAAELLGSENPVGMKIRSSNQAIANSGYFTVIGVVENFHYMSLKEDITPYAMLSLENTSVKNPVGTTLTIKSSGNIQDLISQAESKWSQLVPKEPFKYSFLDTELEKLYKNEINSGKRMTAFSICAIIIACIGLFGLSAYTTGTRTKEIGIRKVMGASVTKVVLLLSLEFSVLIFIAFILAIPLAWFSMSSWLENFAYRIDLDWKIFVFAMGITLAIAWLTVSYQTIKAALANPVKSLRSE